MQFNINKNNWKGNIVESILKNKEFNSILNKNRGIYFFEEEIHNMLRREKYV